MDEGGDRCSLAEYNLNPGKGRRADTSILKKVKVNISLEGGLNRFEAQLARLTPLRAQGGPLCALHHSMSIRAELFLTCCGDLPFLLLPGNFGAMD